jgi:hypothetical protein
MNKLKLVHYNTHRQSDVVHGVLADPLFQDIDVIAIQEPARRLNVNDTVCPSWCRWQPVIGPTLGRVCFLLSAGAAQKQRRVTSTTPDLLSILLDSDLGPVWVHNIYNPPKNCPQPQDFVNPLTRIHEVLSWEGNHILLGDFNLHHPLWSGPLVAMHDDEADSLLDLLGSAGLELLLPPGEATRQGNHQNGTSLSTLDLVFATRPLAEVLVECRARRDMSHGSDHFPVVTAFATGLDPIPATPKRSWKRADQAKISAAADHIPRPWDVSTTSAIDEYVTDLLRFLHETIDLTVPWAKPSERMAPWWCPEVERAILDFRRAERVSHQRPQDRQAWERRVELNKARKRTIRDAKRRQFREDIHRASQNPNGLWRLAKWARLKSHLPREPPGLPPLQAGGGRLTNVFEEKVEILRRRFYPSPADADLSDLNETTPDPVEISMNVSEDEVRTAIRRTANDSAPGPDGIPNRFLKALGKPFVEVMQALISACWKLGYHPKAFRVARTVVLRKPQRGDYTIASSWRPIALLNTVGKLIEAVTARRLRDTAETHHLLPDAQMGNRPNRSTETALEILTEKIHTIWKAGKVASLLSLDITGAFDRVIRARLCHALRMRRIPEWVATWVASFMEDRRTTLSFDGRESTEISVPAGVPQGSPCSPILFLFYIAELHDSCEAPELRVTVSGFADDTNLLAYGNTPAENCHRLERAHERCERWARRYGMSFAPDKYSLVHFTRQRRFNCEYPVDLGDTVIFPTQDVRVLGVWLDPKLNWNAHVREVKQKLSQQINAVRLTTASTWGATLRRARHIYTAVVRPTITYGSAVWHEPRPGAAKPMGPAAALAPIQNRCLRSITGAFRATPVRSLEVEAYVAPLDLYMDKLQAAFRARLKRSGIGRLIQDSCAAIRRRLLERRRGRPPAPNVSDTPGTRKAAWAESWLPPPIPRHPRAPPPSEKVRLHAAELRDWTARWERGRRARTWGEVESPPSNRQLQLHNGLQKAESSILIQLRTARIGFAHFLHKANVPGFETPLCPCGRGPQTTRHVVLWCSNLQTWRPQLLNTQNRLDFDWITTTRAGAERVSRWLIQHAGLKQYALAKKLLYE